MLAHLFIMAALASQPLCDTDEASIRLGEMHAELLAIHLNDDVPSWMEMETETLVVGSRGQVVVSGPDRAEQRRTYLAATEFDYYRDMVPPIIAVSQDCSLGWVIAQVQASGTIRSEAGVPSDLGFQAAWVELYELRDGAWRLTGNVSNFVSP